MIAEPRNGYYFTFDELDDVAAEARQRARLLSERLGLAHSLWCALRCGAQLWPPPRDAREEAPTDDPDPEADDDR